MKKVKVTDSVLYRTRKYDEVTGKVGPVSEGLAAVVTRVWSPTCVNLMVSPHEHGSVPYAVTSVMFDEAIEPGSSQTWRWPE